MTHDATVGIKRIAVSAVVTRADGTVEDLGVIDETIYDTPQPVSASFLSALRSAWVEGWQDGMKAKEEPRG